MDFGINSIVQSLLGEDGRQYCKSLFALGERVGNDENVGLIGKRILQLTKNLLTT
jgi:hypothetical protein